MSALKCQHCGAEQVGDARFCGVCGRATSTTQPTTGNAPPGQAADLTGREIGGRFRIHAKLGEGGMGAVYRGEQISLKRKVAVKLLRPELSRDPAIVRRFNAEAEAVAKLSHPNTVAIFDFGQDADGTLFIAMEYCEGRSLRQELTQGPIPAARALHIASQVAASLSDAHRHGIVHRDLKPDNVMLTERGKDKDVVRVLDFGIAKLRDEQNKATVNPMTQAGDLVGTPQYMAPEQIRGESVDGRTDVYALGAILYEMVTGRMLVEGPTVMAILSRHLLEMPEPPTRRRPDLPIPPAIDALTMEMLAKEPPRRIASMELVTDRIAGVQAQLGVASPVPTPPRTMSRPPGVPNTLPPGMFPPPTGYAQPMHPPPPPQAHVPTHMHGYQPQYTPAPQPMMPPPVAYAMTGAPLHVQPQPSGGSKAWLWILIGLLLAGGVVAAVLVTQQSKDAAENATPSGESITLTGGWTLILPDGFTEVPGAVPEAKSYMGSINGQTAGIVAFAVADDTRNESPADMEDGCKGIVEALFSASFVGGNMVDGPAPQRYRCEFDSGMQRGEGRIYSVSGATLVLFFAADSGSYDGTHGARKELFDRRVKAPSI